MINIMVEERSATLVVHIRRRIQVFSPHMDSGWLTVTCFRSTHGLGLRVTNTVILFFAE